MTTAAGSADQTSWEELRSAWSIYRSAVETWLEEGTTKRSGVDVDHLIHAVIAAHNSWSDGFMRMIEATHHH